MDPDAVSRAFVEHYYQTFDTNRAALSGFYRENSVLSFDGVIFQGSAAITAKLTSFPQSKHNISTIDSQPSGPSGEMNVSASGSLQVAGEDRALKFSQMFHLIATPQGSFYVLNDTFRLNYA